MRNITNMTNKTLMAIFATACINVSASAAPVTAPTAEDVTKISQASGLQPQVVELALKARQFAADHTKINNDTLTIVNYAQPATTPRLYVINLKNDSLMMKIRVAHGRNSGTPDTALHFSNSPQSRESSLGVFVTGNSYSGEHGYSRRIIGLEPNINNNAESRDIVIHPANYVTPKHVGRSFGCLAVNPHDAPKLVSTLVQGSVIFSYAPQELNDKYINSVNI